MKRSKNKNRSTKQAQSPVPQPVPTKPNRTPLIIGLAAFAVIAAITLIVLFGYGVIGRANDLHLRESYTVTNEKAIADADKVIATVGDRTLTNAQFQMYYYMAINEFINYYGDNVGSYGLDVNLALDAQEYPGEAGLTWQQYFMDYALDMWYYYQAMEIAAAEAGYQISDDLAAYLDGLEETMKNTAQNYGYEAALDMIQDDIGAQCTMEDYIHYLTVYCTGSEYYDHLADLSIPSDEDIAAYYAANEAEYVKDGITTDALFVDVRHLLFYPAYSGTDADGNSIATDEDWEACRQKAEELMDYWMENGGSEELFLQLVADYSEDTASNTTGGLYENVYDGEFTNEFNDWCFAESRQPGDQGLIKTKYGYHLMYYVGDSLRWYETVQEDLAEETLNAWVEEIQNSYTMKVDYKHISLAEIIKAD